MRTNILILSSYKQSQKIRFTRSPKSLPVTLEIYKCVPPVKMQTGRDKKRKGSKTEFLYNVI